MRLSLGEVSVSSSGRKALTVTEPRGSAQDGALGSVAFTDGYGPSVCHFLLLLMGHSDCFSSYSTNEGVANGMAREVSQGM